MQAENGTTEGKIALKKGKLIKVRAKFRGEYIEEIRITGDFFIYPEDTIEVLERELKGKRISDVKNIIERVMKNCEYIGVEPSDIDEAVRLAWMRRS